MPWIHTISMDNCTTFISLFNDIVSNLFAHVSNLKLKKCSEKGKLILEVGSLKCFVHSIQRKCLARSTIVQQIRDTFGRNPALRNQKHDTLHSGSIRHKSF